MKNIFEEKIINNETSDSINLTKKFLFKYIAKLSIHRCQELAFFTCNLDQ